MIVGGRKEATEKESDQDWVAASAAALRCTSIPCRHSRCNRSRNRHAKPKKEGKSNYDDNNNNTIVDERVNDLDVTYQSSPVSPSVRPSVRKARLLLSVSHSVVRPRRRRRQEKAEKRRSVGSLRLRAT